MIPLRDELRSDSFPVVTVALIIINAVVFIYQLYIGPLGFERYVYSYGLTPFNLFHSVQLTALKDAQPAMPEFFKAFSSMFMHGGFMHIIMNMWILWIFGDNVEDAMGKPKYLAFYLVCGLVAALSHSIFNPSSKVPLVGASGAIAGVMGAYMILYPRAKIITLLFFFIFIRIVRIPAFFFLGFWFLLQLLYSPAGGAVAYLAHVGGFLAGIALVLVLRKSNKGFRVISVK